MTINTNQEITLWDIANGLQEHPIQQTVIPGHQLKNSIKSAVVSPTGNVLAYVFREPDYTPVNTNLTLMMGFYTLRFFGLITKRELSDFNKTYIEEPSYTFSAQGTHCASAGNENLTLYNLNSEKSLHNTVTFNISAQVESLAPAGDKLLLTEYVHGAGALSMWLITNNNKGRMDISRLWFMKPTVYKPQFSPCGTYVLGQAYKATSREQADLKRKECSIALLDPSSGATLRTITYPFFPRSLRNCTMSSDEQHILFSPIAETEADTNRPDLARLHILDMSYDTQVPSTTTDKQPPSATKYYAAGIPWTASPHYTKLFDVLGPCLAYADPMLILKITVRSLFESSMVLATRKQMKKNQCNQYRQKQT